MSWLEPVVALLLLTGTAALLLFLRWIETLDERASLEPSSAAPRLATRARRSSDSDLLAGEDEHEPLRRAA